MNIFKKNSSSSVIQDDIISLALSADYKSRVKAKKDSNNKTLEAIYHYLGRRARKLAIVLEDGIYIGPYKFVGYWDGSYYCGGLDVIDGTDHVSVTSLSALGSYIRAKQDKTESLITQDSVNNQIIV